MSQFNAFQPEQNSKRELVEAWKIAQEEYKALLKRDAVSLKKHYCGLGIATQYLNTSN